MMDETIELAQMMDELLKRLDATGFGWRLTSIWFSWGRRYVCQIGDLEADIHEPCNYFKKRQCERCGKIQEEEI